ncbi:sickle tail protein homolog [Chanos chanos]|uniref:Sickle tail protein homolog n=1 Tax=Chanos chanos TaxID=29144 RepID=A0A6J2USW6_CHACN|nr:sickle tail protein-like [Chanos chanos]
MQPSDMDKKREAFLEHLKQKYPHHASAIMGHQERLREQLVQWMLVSLHSEIDIQRYLLKIQSLPQDPSRSPRHTANPGGVSSFGDQVDQGSLGSLDALEVMSECDAPLGFTRGSRSRASLPVVRSANQTKDRSLGVLYLQYGDESKQMRMPNEISSVDTVRALFVSAFPQHLTMSMLESPSTAIYIKDHNRNMYYELSDVRSIADHSCLKVYHKDPAHAFSHAPRPSNGMHREMMYPGRDGPHPLRQPPMGPPPPHVLQGSMSPTTPHAMPPSPSRIPFGPRPGGGGPAGAGAPVSGGTIQRERVTHTMSAPARSASPCPSAILERRDVKPDEDLCAKGGTLPPRVEGIYADPYLMHHPPPPDAVDHAYHRASIRSYGNPGVPMESAEHHSLYRQKSRNSQLPTLGSKTPPPSPHRMGDMRMIDIHTGQPQGPLVLERSSPIRQSFRKEAPVSMETVVKGRGPLAPSVTPDLQGRAPSDPQTQERMKAMEEQIASLTGLVQTALLKGQTTNGTKDSSSDRSVKSGSPVHSTSSAGGSPVLMPKSATLPPESSPAPTPPVGPAPTQVNFAHLKQNVSELRLQLQQMRQLQIQNQECVRAQLKRVEQEISVKLGEILRTQEDPAHRQRSLVDEDRHKYLSMEEKVLTELGDLEQYVEGLKRDSGSTQRAVTLREVEDGAVGLRKVGESLAGLKGEFPALQTRMRAVLRVEVEAVKFLKEEPHKLDSMLKRVKTLTETLSHLRRCATEGLLKPSEPVTMTTLTATEEAESSQPVEVRDSPSTTPLPEPQGSSVRSEVMNSSPVVIHHAQSSPVPMQKSQHSVAPTTNATQGRISPPSPVTQSGSPSQLKKTTAAPPEQTPPASNTSNGVPSNSIHGSAAVSAAQNLFIEEIHTSHSKSKNRAMSIEAAEREWEEKRQNMGHYDSREFERMLQEAEANMLRGIPSLEVPSEAQSFPAPPAGSDEVFIEKTEPAAAPPQEEKPSEANSERPVKTGPEKPPKPVSEKASKPTPERSPKASLTAKASLERPAKSSGQDKVTKLNQASEKASKSPPPPPPRRNYTSAPGMTTTRTGEVIYTSRKESLSAQEGEEELSVSAQAKQKTPPEVKTKPCTPPPIAASAITEDEDEGDKIMAELQVFQKCSIKDVGLKGLVEPQVREIRAGALLPLKDKKNTDNREDKDPVTDENGNNTIRQSSGVIYYVTAQISKETPQPSLTPEESNDRRDVPLSPSSQVSHVNTSDQSQSPQQVVTDGPTTNSKSNGPATNTSPPVSLPQTHLTRSESLKINLRSATKDRPSSVPQKQFTRSGSLKINLPSTTGDHSSSLPQKHLSRSGSLKINLSSPKEEGKRGMTVSKVHVVKSPPLQISVEERVESPTKCSVPTPTTIGETPPVFTLASTGQAGLSGDSQQPVLGSSRARERKYEEDNLTDDAGLSPDLPGEEPPPPPDNIAFMITNTKVQALSTGEYQELVNAKRGSVQTVTVGNKRHVTTNGALASGDATQGSELHDMDNGGFNKKPVIIIFDEPMDIHSAYKRLSTIFECEEELDRMLAEERIDEVEEEEEAEESSGEMQVKKGSPENSGKVPGGTPGAGDHHTSSSSSSLSEGGPQSDPTGDSKQDSKKKFKFKFPKKQLAALTQAIRTGTKTGKKTLQVVVYEDEEESDGTLKPKEAKRFEIARSKQDPKTTANPQDLQGRTDEIRKSTYKTLDSLEQTIKQLESTISEMGPRLPEEGGPAEDPKPQGGQGGEAAAPEKNSTPKSLMPKSSGSSKSSGSRKKPKPQLLPRPATIPTAGVSVSAVPTHQNANAISPTSRMPVPVSAKARQQPGTSEREKAAKQQKLQDSQRQFRQANGSAKRSGGDPKSTSPSVPASKIPAFSSSVGKGFSQSDATNSINSSSLSSSPSSSSLSANKSSIPSPRSSSASSSHIPSLSNGSLKLAPPTHTAKGLSFSSQTQNGRPSSSSSSSSSSTSSPHSPLSPTMLAQGVKTIRTIHTPSFTSYSRPHNGSGGKSAIPTATATKDCS